MAKETENKETAQETPVENVQETETDPGEEYVEYTAPLLDAHGESPDIFVSVNGKNCVIKRGETVKIKRKFLEVIRASEAQDVAAYKVRKTAQSDSKTPMAEL